MPTPIKTPSAKAALKAVVTNTISPAKAAAIAAEETTGDSPSANAAAVQKRRAELIAIKMTAGLTKRQAALAVDQQMTRDAAVAEGQFHFSRKAKPSVKSKPANE
jgi:hypothetical protein